MPLYRLLAITASLLLSTGGPMAAEAVRSAAIVTAAPTGNGATTNRPPVRTSPYSQSYQAARQSQDALVQSMAARRDALRKQMQARRDEIARQRAALPRQGSGFIDGRQLQDQKQRNGRNPMEMAARQKKYEEKMKTRRKAMETRIDQGIDAIGRPAFPLHYPVPACPPRPGTVYPYRAYIYPQQ